MQKKITYLERIRTLAIILVIFNHTGPPDPHGFFFFSLTDRTWEYVSSLTLSIICRIAVPLFFMVSGYLLIERNEDLKTVIKKRILRMVIVILIASMIHYLIKNVYIGQEAFSVREFVKILYRCDIPSYWFMYAYLGILFILPLVQGIKKAITKEMVYFLIFLRVTMCGLLPIAIFVALGYHMNNYLNNYIIPTELFYFIIGWYFGNDKEIVEQKKTRIVLIILSTMSIILSGVMTRYEYKVTGEYSVRFFDGLIPFVAITVFLLVKYYDEKRKRCDQSDKVIIFLGDKAFGVYLLEPILRALFVTINKYLINISSDVIGSILFTFFLFGVGVIIVWIIKLLPFMKKFI